MSGRSRRSGPGRRFRYDSLALSLMIRGCCRRERGRPMTADRNQAGCTDASGAHGAGLVVMWVRRRTSGAPPSPRRPENLHDGRNDDDPGRHRRVGPPGRGQGRARPRPGRRHPVRQAAETGREGHPLDAGTLLQARPRIAGRGPAQHHRLPAPDGGAGHGDRGRLPARHGHAQDRAATARDAQGRGPGRRDPRRAEAARRPRRGPHPRIHPPRQPPAEPAAADPPRV